MLSLRNIKKDYGSGESAVRALNGVSLDFRENEFVSILGPSGCGKTTLLNIVGGLDQYTSGDLIINGISTKEYLDADWDTYRNHSIGFVFQSYNLIPHQSVLANVELALTLSGISKAERRKRATEALRQVGLGDQINKRPNQLSGGQMQRVAIARALVNDPDILLADEPTGALDTQTSVQIMDILREVSKKKLIIMVTHNPDLAEEYSTRIIRVLDGQVVSDSNPYINEAVPQVTEEDETQPKLTKQEIRRLRKAARRAAAERQAQTGVKKGKKSMSFLTALSLSFNNLMTKKARTFMTAFAGSIGIIGIALILSVSTGVNNYINAVQRDTLASYPIQLDAESVDMESLISTMMSLGEDEELDHDLDKVYESMVFAEMMNSLTSIETNTNDLKAFKKHVEENSDKFNPYLTAIQYSYDFNWSILVREGNTLGDPNAPGRVYKADVMEWLTAQMGGMGSMGSDSSSSSMMMGGSSSNAFNPWQELIKPIEAQEDGSLVNNVLKEQYELIDGGHWPEATNEVVLIVNENNEISDITLFALGLRTEAEMQELLEATMLGQPIDTSNRKSWTYDEIKQMEFRLFLASECYNYENGTVTERDLEELYTDPNSGFTLKVVGIVRPNPDATGNMLSGSIGYTYALTQEALKRTLESDLIAAQRANTTIDLVSGLPFKTFGEFTNAEKYQAVKALINSDGWETVKGYLLNSVSDADADALLATMNDPAKDAMLQAFWNALPPEQQAAFGGSLNAITSNPEMKLMALRMIAKETVKENLNTGITSREALEAYLTEEKAIALYNSDAFPKGYAEHTHADALIALGDVSEDSPSTMYLYASSFENKDAIAALIEEYNKGVPEEKQITYTDIVALLMSSITTIVNAITYVLIAFVGISLVVSSIMIGIITYISVLERTKEIGILRAIGASKKDIRRVFNAEAITVGFVAGMIGIAATLLFNIIINIILFKVTGIAALKASLPILGAIILVLISVFLTFIAGLFPSRFAAKRNPVEALRSE